MTSFGGHPTGRNCNGRLIIDFIAQGLGLPLVPPYLSHKGSFQQGANFAVGGATALNSSFFHIGDPPGASPFPLNTSLEVQLGWFEELKPSLCQTDQECKDFFGRSLFFVGEFGINDYHYSFGKKSMQEIRAFVPDLIQTISMGAEARPLDSSCCSCHYCHFESAYMHVNIMKTNAHEESDRARGED
uniref:GDSL esterase/lipase n=1 Tax=Aegilops tauschii subsp. strangulata TaxID=200361 RepID=A0A453QIF5_AEGTS